MEEKVYEIVEDKKYELILDDNVIIRGCNRPEITLYRIRALRDFNDVKKGTLGGYIEKEDNLSHNGDCWVYDNAKVFEDAIVYGNAKVRDTAYVLGHAEIFENSTITHQAQIHDYVKVYGNAYICDCVEIRDHAEVCGKTVITGSSNICSNAFVQSNRCWMVIDGFFESYCDSRLRHMTIFRCKDDKIKIDCMAEREQITLDEFIENVTSYKYDSIYIEEHVLLIKLIKHHFAIFESETDDTTKYKKFVLTEETTNMIKHDSISGASEVITLYRIKAVKDFGNIKIGDLGGFVEKESNLSHEDNCWIYSNAKVFGNARVFDDAKILDDSIVYGDAKIHADARICGNAQVHDNAIMYGNSIIKDFTHVHGTANIYGDVMLTGYAEVCGDTMLCGNAQIRNNAYVCGQAGPVRVYDGAIIRDTARVVNTNTNVICIGGDTNISDDAIISSDDDYISIGGFGAKLGNNATFFKCKDTKVKVNCGQFNGTLGCFIEKINECYKHDEKYKKEYLSLVDLVKLHFNVFDDECDNIVLTKLHKELKAKIFNMVDKTHDVCEYNEQMGNPVNIILPPKVIGEITDLDKSMIIMTGQDIKDIINIINTNIDK